MGGSNLTLKTPSKNGQHMDAVFGEYLHKDCG
jgi:hypothetical protein